MRFTLRRMRRPVVVIAVLLLVLGHATPAQAITYPLRTVNTVHWTHFYGLTSYKCSTTALLTVTATKATGRTTVTCNTGVFALTADGLLGSSNLFYAPSLRTCIDTKICVSTVTRKHPAGLQKICYSGFASLAGSDPQGAVTSRVCLRG